MKDGVAIAYKSGQKLTANGSYVLKFSNYDGYTKTYTFVVDTVAPMVTLEVAKNGEFVNAGVNAHFAKDETAEVFKDESCSSRTWVDLMCKKTVYIVLL